jgi:hypothetical protein
MPHHVEPLTAVQIHSVYAPEGKPKTRAIEMEAPRYSKASFSGREPSHSGHSPQRPESTNKKKKY